MSTMNVDCWSSIDFENTDTLPPCTLPHQPPLEMQNSSPIVYKNDDDFYTKHNVHCKVCSLPGKVLYCSSCTLVFHLHCVRPSLKKYPSDDWKCAFCLEECNESNQRIQNQAKKVCQEMKQMQIDMGMEHARVGQKLLKNYIFMSFYNVLKLSSGHHSNVYKCNRLPLLHK
jgi:hypothetical protein